MTRNCRAVGIPRYKWAQKLQVLYRKMTESAPLLDDFDENVPHVGEAHTGVYTPANSYFRPLFKILAITTVVISAVAVVLLIATYIILEIQPWGNPYVWPWNARRATKALAIYVCAPIFLYTFLSQAGLKLQIYRCPLPLSPLASAVSSIFPSCSMSPSTSCSWCALYQELLIL